MSVKVFSVAITIDKVKISLQKYNLKFYPHKSEVPIKRITEVNKTEKRKKLT